MAMLLKIFGIVAILMGGLWIGQGAGWILWPASSFMIDQSQWIYIGAGLMLLGALALWRGQKRR